MPVNEDRDAQIQRFALIFGLIIAFLVTLPSIVGILSKPAGGAYLGFHSNFDDHMVYSAWATQAAEGRFLFENRFTTDPQPGLTIHLLFWAIGQVGRFLGVPLAMTLARIAFSVAFAVLLGRFVIRFKPTVFVGKLAITFATLGGGIGFAVWHRFGVAMGDETPGFLRSIMLSRLPVDVWQPEAMVLPSMLTNALFMASLCLIMVVLTAVIDSRESSKPVLGGALAMLVLANIHSYDALLMALILGGLLVASAASKTLHLDWAKRVLMIGAGALPSGAYLAYVLKVDPVFQARAATLTYSPNFRAILFGFLPLLILWVIGFTLSNNENRQKSRITALCLTAGLLCMYFLAADHLRDDFWMGWPAWVVAYAAACLISSLGSSRSVAWNLGMAWASVGLIAPYVPTLFQRKLAMGLAIPLGIMAAYGLAEILSRLERSARNLVTVLVILLGAASSALWIQRDFWYIGQNVSNTTVHSIFLTRDADEILKKVAAITGRKVVAAMPGMPHKDPNYADRYETPYLADLNSVMTGLGGAYSYAGHWSETPDYANRRGELFGKLYSLQATPETRAEFLKQSGINLIIVPQPEAYPQLQVANLDYLGETLYSGSQLKLIRIP